VNFQPESIDAAALDSILREGGFAASPDFVIWGRVPFVGRTSLVRVGAVGIFAIAVFDESCVHVIGRSERDENAQGRFPGQAVLREVGFDDIKSVVLTTAGGLGGLLTVNVGDGAGLLREALAGGNIMLTLSREQFQGQKNPIHTLKGRVSLKAKPSPAVSQANSADVAQQLAELTKMWSAGALQDHEFEAGKKKILGI